MQLLGIWNRLAPRPGGRRLLSWPICRRAPHFSTISPTVVELAPGRCVASMAHRGG